MQTDRAWIDIIYDFKGLWEVDSKCGLKVIDTDEASVFIVTELFNENPGTSITNFCAQLATELRARYNVPHDRFIYIEHCPDRGSRLEFQQETFDLVTLKWDGERFISPKWKRISPAQVDRLIGNAP
ncbi:MAG: hypothetical protein GXP54_11565 [Deltaproteobacteria bacterium]|nr:hypothetical protein [Deltaproteobacteria bacterium]